MRVLMSEQESSTLLHEILDGIFDGYEIKYEGDGRNIYVDGNLFMILNPTSSVIDKTILEKIQNILYYDNMSDFKDEVRRWIIDNFGIKKSSEPRYGIQFKNLLGAPEPPKVKKIIERERKPAMPKKTREQLRKEREGYSNYLKAQKEFEDQLNLQESNDMQRLKRRVSYENLEKFIMNAELEFPTLCDDFDDAFEYADAVISRAVDDFLSSIDDFYEDDDYDDVYNIVFDLCKDWFGDRQMDIYMSTCEEEEDEDMMFEQAEMGINNVVVKLFGLLNEEKKKKKTKQELLESIKNFAPYLNIPKGHELYLLELYSLNYRKDGDYSGLTKDNFVDPRDGRGKTTSNAKSNLYTIAQLPFKGSNLEGYWDKDRNGKKYYIVKSWGWYPVYIQRDGIWYETVDRYSSSTSGQMYRSQPYDYSNKLNSKVYYLTQDEMDMILRGSSHEEVMKSKREKFKKLEPELKAKKLTTDRPFLGWNDGTPNFNIKFKINSIDEGDDKLTVNVDIYDVVKRVEGKGVPTPENYLKGELRDVTPKLVEDKLKQRLRTDFKKYIGSKYENVEDTNIEFKFNHLKK
jgi:hypothetical protein